MVYLFKNLDSTRKSARGIPLVAQLLLLGCAIIVWEVFAQQHCNLQTSSAVTFCGMAGGAVLTVSRCSTLFALQVGVRLTTSNRTPTHISVHWTRCHGEDQEQSVTDDQFGIKSQLNLPEASLAAQDQEEPDSTASAEERVEPESIAPGAETVVPIPETVRGRCICS